MWTRCAAAVVATVLCHGSQLQLKVNLVKRTTAQISKLNDITCINTKSIKFSDTDTC
jgi:hypothetical protein